MSELREETVKRCVFCREGLPETYANPWHIDCLDTAIEQEYGITTMNAMWEFVSDKNSKTIPDWLEHIIKRGSTGGTRHRIRGMIIINLFQRGYEPEEIQQIVHEFNLRCKPPEDLITVNVHIKHSIRRLQRAKGNL